MVVSLSVSEGQRVTQGDRLASIEAMKMETAVFAEIDGVVEEIVAAAGTHVDADDLLLVVQPADGDTGGADEDTDAAGDDTEAADGESEAADDDSDD